MADRVCKKCGKILPDSYKSNKCEACKNQAAQKMKRAGKGTLHALGYVLGIIVTGVAFVRRKP